MPYIKQERREALAWTDSEFPATPGELAYIITRTLIEYAALNCPTENFQCITDLLGALEAAKLEFYRRVVAPYEDKKREENGDVY